MAETEKKKYDEYIESDAVRAAKDALDQQMAQKPGAYQSQWQNSLNEAMNKILNREKFSYDLNGDALYNQYKDRYVQQGKQAMQDTIGSASALTGGYGNSWAQSAGQQAYHGYLQGLNDKVPELYQMALDKYNMEGQDLLNQYGLLSDREGQDYGRYRDALSDYLTERNFLTDRYDTERNYDYGMFSDNRDFNYAQDRDAVADARWQAEFDEAIKRFLATADPATRAYYEAYGKTPEEGTGSTGNPVLDFINGLLGGSTGSKWVGTGTKKISSKSDDNIVNEIIQGKWGNGQDRKDALKKAGYSDDEIKAFQQEVNKKMEGVVDEGVVDEGVVDEGGFTKEELEQELDNTDSVKAKANLIMEAYENGLSEEEAEKLQKKYGISDFYMDWVTGVEEVKPSPYNKKDISIK